MAFIQFDTRRFMRDGLRCLSAVATDSTIHIPNIDFFLYLEIEDDMVNTK